MGYFNKLKANVVELSYAKLADIRSSYKQIQGNIPGNGIGVSGINVSKESPRQAAYPNWFFTARIGQPRNIDILEIRDLAKSPWAQMVMNTFRKQVFTTDWDVVPEEEEDENNYEDKIAQVKTFLKNVNQNRQTISSLSAETITDIAEIDAGVWNFIYSSDSYDIGDVPIYNNWGIDEGKTEIGLVLKPFGQRTIVGVKSVDGGSILKQVDIYKNLLRFYQYSFKHPIANPIMFEPDEIGYMALNVSPSSVYGFSPIQAAQQVLEALIQGTRWNKDMYQNNAIPDFIVSLPKLQTDDLKKLKRMWNDNYRGKPHQVGFINWAMENITKLTSSQRDMEWLNGLNFYKNVIFAVFGVSPTEAGFFENSNRSNDQGQERVTVRNALKPYYKIFENMVNTRLIPEILQEENPGIKFKFTPKDQEKEKIEFDQDIMQVKEGLMTPNEFRRKYGREEKEGGDDLRQNNSGLNPFQFGGQPQSPNNPVGNEPDKANKSIEVKKKDNIIDAGNDVVEEAENYADFLNKTFDNFEKKTLAAVDKLDKAYLNKTFGEFLRGLFNSVNTVAFASKVRKYLKTDLVKGMVSAEAELNTDIGFTENYQNKLNQLASQQIDGYLINGKKWPGIKGVSKEIQAKVIQTVQEGIANNKTISEIKEDIKSDYDKFTDWRANMIARTESGRVLNSGKLLGYKETGIKGKKVWASAQPRGCKNCSGVCDRLDKQERDLDDDFIDPETGRAYPHPPAIPNCKSTIFFRPE